MATGKFSVDENVECVRWSRRDVLVTVGGYKRVLNEFMKDW